ncbi:Hypothetical Protein FCC1311_112502 [Hondaea fermentalgiana]|uniref:Uncharacterized protein n=1 Tax=Hondaea fermentalgiana TaxID=2315210 RepID=A0A2R5GW21_9STRA|nr:Hypothetical Protein FCC1311_112502 [Hondaea fermentalgiana]|eukprot:GBG35027.1 Hypothetical Protein FCC1311_112502 [Hondaea fermentalgiana]
MYDETSAQWGPGRWWYKDVELSHLEVFYTKFTPGDARGDWARETFEEMYRMHARRILASENLGSWSAVTPVTTTRTASALDL